MTSASVHDRQAAAGWGQAGDGVLSGDRAEGGQPVREQRAAQGVEAVSVQKGARGRARNETEKAGNRESSGTRARVGQAFAVRSGQAGRSCQRHVGRARNPAASQRLDLCYNLKRHEPVLRLKLWPLAAA